jgi:hypothetical protein
VRGRLDPSAVVGDAGVGPDGANDGVAGNCRAVAVLQNAIERGAHVAGAASVEPCGAGVAIDHALVDLVGLTDVVGMLPLDELVFDFVALGVAANEAPAFMALAISFG